MSGVVGAVGAVAFGLTVGYLTYRTLVRAKETAVSDLASVIAAIGGGVVTTLYDPHGDSFGWYAIGLAAGMACYGLVFRLHAGKEKAAEALGGWESPRRRDSTRPREPHD